MRVLVFLLLAAILASLFSALFLLLSKRDGPPALAKALTLRIGLSILLFVLLLVGYWSGLIGG